MSEVNTSADLPGANGISNPQALDTTELLSNPEIMKAVGDAVSADGDGGASITEGEQDNLNKLMSTFAALRDGNLSNADRSSINGEASPQPSSAEEDLETAAGSASSAGGASALDAAPTSIASDSDSAKLESLLSHLLKSLEGKLSQEELNELIEQIIKLFTGDTKQSPPSARAGSSDAAALDAAPQGAHSAPALAGGQGAAPAGNTAPTLDPGGHAEAAPAEDAGTGNTAPTLDSGHRADAAPAVGEGGEVAPTDAENTPVTAAATEEGADTLTAVIEKAVDGVLSGKLTAEDAAKVIAAAAEGLKGEQAAGGGEAADANFMVEYKNARADGKIDENEMAHLDRLAADAGRHGTSSTPSTASTASTQSAGNSNALMGMLQDMNLSDAEREQFNKSIKG